MGYFVLEGGAEFGGDMSIPDRRAMALAGGNDAQICIIPAAAAPDHNHQQAGQNGVRWFQKLGARHVTALPLIDHASANDPHTALQLANADLVYLLGGFPGHLAKTLSDSVCWKAIQEGLQSDLVLAGSSAGAMVLCEKYYDPESGQVEPGLNLVSAACVLPHHNTFGKNWAPKLARLLPNYVLIGIDEATGMINDGDGDFWQVYGAGYTTLYREEDIRRYGIDTPFGLDAQPSDTPP